MLPLDNDKSLPHHDERPSSLQIQISQAVLSNCRVGAKCSQTDILNDLQDFIGSRLYADMSVFPNDSNDLHPYSNAAWLNDYSINHHQLQNLTKRDRTLYSRLRRDKNLPHQIWCFWCDQIWVEFSGVQKACDRPISFIDAFPLRIWVCTDVPYYESSETLPSASTLSSDSVEVAEVATEFDEYQDVKYSKMNVVYDVNIGRVDHETRSLHNHNRLIPLDFTTASASSSPGPRRGSLNTRMFETSMHRDSHDKNTRSNNLLQDSQPDNDPSSLRTSLSENDLNLGPLPGQPNHPPGSKSAQNFIDARVVSNYACGGPPPPYSDDASDVKSKDNLNTSFSSLPPAYESLPEEVGSISKPVINDFIQYDMDSSDLERNASVALLMHTSKNVQVQLDHFQLLFLIRLGENFSAMMEKIEGDNEKASRERKISLSQLNPNVNEAVSQLGIVLNMMIPNVIVDLVLSPCIGIDPIQTYNLLDRVRYEKEKSENLSVKFPPSVDRSDCLPIISSCEGTDSMTQVSNDVICGETVPEVSEKAVLCDYTTEGNQPSAEGDTFHMKGDYYLASSDSNNDIPDARVPPHMDQQEGQTFLTEYNIEPPTESNSMQDLYLDTLNIPNETDSTSSHDIETFDQTLKEVADVGIQVGNSMMDVNLKPRPEDQLISVLRIRVGSLFIGIEAEGKDSLVKVSTETLQLNELGNMKYGKILDPRGIIGTQQIHEKRQVNMNPLTGNAVLKLRLGTGSYAEDLEEGSSETGFADIRINALAAALLMSTIDNLQEFGEDEIVSLGLPFTVNVASSDITIYDDKPRRYKSAVKLPPSHVVIDDVFIIRGKDGVATIKEKLGRNDDFTEITNPAGEVPSIAMCNATVNGNLIAESINQQVNALIGENSRLLEDLKVVNAKMNGLHSERDSLLKVIDKLQQELVFSNRENDDLHNRIRTLSLSRHQGHYV